MVIGTDTGNLIAAKCSCGEIMIPARFRCIVCTKTTSEIELGNTGTIITFTILNVPPEGFSAPLILGLIELEPANGEPEACKPKLLCEGKVSENYLKIGLKVKINHADGKYMFTNLVDD
jgi:uncharacterized OB-fold protein